MWRSTTGFLVLQLFLLITPGVAQQLSVPLRFERNAGQAGADVKYIARASAYTALLDETGLTIRRSTHPIRMRFAGASRPVIEPIDEMNIHSNYYTGDARQWRKGIRNFQRLKFENIYSGVDVVFYGNGRNLQFDFVLAPKTDAKNIVLAFSGHQELELTNSNELRLRTEDGTVNLSAPGIYQMLGGKRANVNGRFVKRTADTIGIALGAYDRDAPLIIDPVVSFSTYLGGPGAQESVNDIKVDAAGSAYVTYDDYDDTGPSHDFVVNKISPIGGNGYSTVLGHFHSDESATAIQVDASGNAYVTGWAYSYPDDHPRFPSLNALQPVPAGGVDAVLVKLNPQGEVVFSTYLGGSGNDHGRDLTLDSAGNIYVTGTTSSNDFPVRNPFQALRVPGGTSDSDVFVTKINPSGTAILYSTYLGGDDDDLVASIAVDAVGSIYLAGSTKSSVFAGRTIARGSSPLGLNWSGYAVKFNPAGTALDYSFVWSDVRDDRLVQHAALDNAGNLYIAESGFVRKLNAPGRAFIYMKNIPAGVLSVAIDSQGNAYAVGRTSTEAQNSSKAANNRAYVAKIPPDGSAFAFETSLNGTIRNPVDPNGDAGSTVATAIAVAPSGAVYVGGYSESFNFPTTNGSTRSRSTAASTQDAILFIIQPE
jgi:Beta-propeller repeat